MKICFGSSVVTRLCRATVRIGEWRVSGCARARCRHLYPQNACTRSHMTERAHLRGYDHPRTQWTEQTVCSQYYYLTCGPLSKNKPAFIAHMRCMTVDWVRDRFARSHHMFMSVCVCAHSCHRVLNPTVCPVRSNQGLRH
jgi:hypothetical protein